MSWELLFLTNFEMWISEFADKTWQKTRAACIVNFSSRPILSLVTSFLDDPFYRVGKNSLRAPTCRFRWFIRWKSAFLWAKKRCSNYCQYFMSFRGSSKEQTSSNLITWITLKLCREWNKSHKTFLFIDHPLGLELATVLRKMWCSEVH